MIRWRLKCSIKSLLGLIRSEQTFGRKSPAKFKAAGRWRSTPAVFVTPRPNASPDRHQPNSKVVDLFKGYRTVQIKLNFTQNSGRNPAICTGHHHRSHFIWIRPNDNHFERFTSDSNWWTSHFSSKESEKCSTITARCLCLLPLIDHLLGRHGSLFVVPLSLSINARPFYFFNFLSPSSFLLGGCTRRRT